MTGYDDKLDHALGTAMSGILAELESAFDPDLGLADIYARSTRSKPYPARAVPGRDHAGSSRLAETCDQIDALTAWLADLIRSGQREPFGGASFVELARDNLVELRAGLAARIMTGPEAQRLATDIHNQLGQADQILRSQNATTLDHLAAASSRHQGAGALTGQVQVMRQMITRLYEPDGHDLCLTPAR